MGRVAEGRVVIVRGGVSTPRRIDRSGLRVRRDVRRVVTVEVASGVDVERRRSTRIGGPLLVLEGQKAASMGPRSKV